MSRARRPLLSLALLVLALSPVLSLGHPAQAAVVSPAQTRPAPADPAPIVVNGFSITDAEGLPFAQTYLQLGTDVVGLPISRRFTWDGFTVQAFQKVIMQWQPGTQQIYFVNIIDIMHDQGLDDWLQVVRATPPPLPPSFDAGAANFDEITQRRLALLNENPAIAQVYNASPAPILQFGLPTSRVIDNGSHYVMRFQRVIIQQWKEAVPWAAAGQVTIANGGDIAKEVGLLPQTALIPDNGSADTATGTVTPVPPAAPPSAAPAPPAYGPESGMAYGMAIFESSDLDRALTYTANAGFGWARIQLRWDVLEKTPGAIDWTYIDPAINTIAARGLRLLINVTAAPSWSRFPGAEGVPNGPPNGVDLARFVAAIAARHPGRIGAIEVWNEQNLGREWGTGQVNAANYVQVLCTVYPAVKAADPNIIVLSGAPTPTGINEPGNVVDDLTYIDQMYQAGVQNCLDGLGAHPEGYGNPPDDDPTRNSKGVTQFVGDWSFYFRRFEQYRDVMVRYGDTRRRIWFTEMGWASLGNPAPNHGYAALNTEADQAAYLIRAFELARSTGYVGGIMLWNLNYGILAKPGDPEAKLASGIIRADWSPRPAYTAVAAMPKP